MSASCKSICLWLLLNACCVRPAFRWLNINAFLDWKCTPGPHARGSEVAANTSGLKLIVAGGGHSGTTSVQTALELLGLRTYHSDDVSFYLPEFQLSSTAATELPGPLRRCGVDAFITEPYLEITEKLLAVSPGAKVLLMTRRWEDWVRAWRQQSECMWPYLVAQVLAGWSFCHWLPHGLVWPSSARGHSFVRVSLTSLLLENCLVYTGFWKRHHGVNASYEPPLKHEMLRNRTAHDAHADMVRRAVPPGDLLEFDVRRHGWAELAALLGRPAPPPGVPFPRLRTKGFCTAFLARWQAAPATHAAFWVLMLASIWLNWLAYRCLARLLRLAARRLAGHAKHKGA